ncbi:ribonuclease H-like domain-containing protein [Romboutsia sp. Marseille-P6047]|uniref:ribonuclease H-like domain-containing protein n=1 Tax=Romboutsia sp. Marseille-P6047 TaxID=2161817 RepID=UPI000F054E1F|nr:ribonuclease H-like domain-containing protein [Romboutsia sp. Marseille-P6047]
MEIIKHICDDFIDIPKNHFVFDIETTGLSPKFSKVILIGIVYNENNKTIIKQFFALNENEEKELLLAFINNINSFEKHITFNGFTFDIPFLNSRLKKHNIDFHLNKDDDIDILRIVKPYKEKLCLLDCKLKTIEKYLGIDRNDTISGKESVELYKEFEASQNETIKSNILLHNYEDIYYLSKMLKIQDIIIKNLNPLILDINNQILKLVPTNYKITKTNLIMKYKIFSGDIYNIKIYKDNYSIFSEKNNLNIDIDINKGIDSNNNEILFYKLSTIIPLKFNADILEDNINSLCNFLVKKELTLI